MSRQCRRPAPPQDRPSGQRTDATDFNRRTDIELAVAVVTDAGLTVAGRCQDCGQALVNPASIARARGPKCAAKSRAGAVVR